MIQADSLSFFYSAGKAVLNDISFQAEQGLCTAILGNNGAGKSTLLKCLNRIITPKQGVVKVDGSDVGAMTRQQIAQKIAYVAQRTEPARFTVFDAVLLGRKPYIKLHPTEEDIRIVDGLLEQLGLSEMALCHIDELSGGELQKVMLAMALAQQPKVLLLDEPTSSLDLKNQYGMLGLVRKLARQRNICVILVIHDLNLALRFCDRFLFLKDRKLFAYGGLEVMTPEILQKVYGLPVTVEQVGGAMVVVPRDTEKTD